MYYTPDSLVSGLSYGQWTVKWWQWSLSIPADRNPVLDNTGINAGENQPEDVWFLAGIWADGNTMKIFPKRECKIPVWITSFGSCDSTVKQIRSNILK